jgi:hypothetical protein
VAQFSCFNWMVEKKKFGKIIWKIQMMPHVTFSDYHVNILVYIVIANVVIGIHPWIHIKFSYLHSMKKWFICRLWLMVICNLLFASMLIFSHNCHLHLKFNHKQHFFYYYWVKLNKIMWNLVEFVWIMIK